MKEVSKIRRATRAEARSTETSILGNARTAGLLLTIMVSTAYVMVRKLARIVKMFYKKEEEKIHRGGRRVTQRRHNAA